MVSSKPRPLRMFHNVITGAYMQENPCYCGGYVRFRMLDNPRKPSEIINCFQETMKHRKFKNAGWIEIKGFFNGSK